MFLKRLIEEKKEILEEKKKRFPLKEMEEALKVEKKKDFYSLFSKRQEEDTKIIAEIKRASPSRGRIGKEFDLFDLIKKYERGGAQAISIITEERYFEGSLSYLKKTRSLTGLPLLRKDFIFDPYEIIESKFYGADAILLIGEILEKERIEEFLSLSEGLNLDCLLEIHKKETLEKVLKIKGKRFILGINSRDLETLFVDLSWAEKLLEYVPEDMPVIVESGIKNREDIERFKRFKVSGFLIGTTLLESFDPVKKLKELRGDEG